MASTLFSPHRIGFAKQRVFQREGGYGLVEMALVLGLMTISMAAVVPVITRTLQSFQLAGAARDVLAQIRNTQSLAVSRVGVYGFQWGADTGMLLPASQSRIVRDTTGTCTFPAKNDPVDGSTVIAGWHNLTDDYSGVTIESIRDNNNLPLGGVMFNAMGASVNTCTGVSFPITVTLSNTFGATRVIQIRAAGGTTLQ